MNINYNPPIDKYLEQKRLPTYAMCIVVLLAIVSFVSFINIFNKDSNILLSAAVFVVCISVSFFLMEILAKASLPGIPIIKKITFIDNSVAYHIIYDNCEICLEIDGVVVDEELDESTLDSLKCGLRFRRDCLENSILERSKRIRREDILN